MPEPAARTGTCRNAWNDPLPGGVGPIVGAMRFSVAMRAERLRGAGKLDGRRSSRETLGMAGAAASLSTVLTVFIGIVVTQVPSAFRDGVGKGPSFRELAWVGVLGAEVLAPLWILLPLVGAITAALLAAEKFATTVDLEEQRRVLGMVGFATSWIVLYLYALVFVAWLCKRVNGGEILVLTIAVGAIVRIGVTLGSLQARRSPESVLRDARRRYATQSQRFLEIARGRGGGTSSRALVTESLLANAVNAAALLAVMVLLRVLVGPALTPTLVSFMAATLCLIVVLSWVLGVAAIFIKWTTSDRLILVPAALFGLAFLLLTAWQVGSSTGLLLASLLVGIMTAAVANRRGSFALGSSARRVAARLVMIERVHAIEELRAARVRLEAQRSEDEGRFGWRWRFAGVEVSVRPHDKLAGGVGARRPAIRRRGPDHRVGRRRTP